MKKKVFIGCSKKEISLAEKARELLEQDGQFEVRIWSDDFWKEGTNSFRLNDSILDGLIKTGLMFDCAIIIGTKDDEVNKKGKLVLQARDNVIFELGFFMGRLGRYNCAFAVEKDLNVMTDFNGILLSKFSKDELGSFENTIRAIKHSFLEPKNCEINFFPSTTLAGVYLQNLIKPTYEEISRKGGLKWNGNTSANWKFRIILPKNLSSNVNQQFENYKVLQTLKQFSIHTMGRPRKLHLDISTEDGEPIIVDFPTIIAGIDHAIRSLLPRLFEESGDKYRQILARELERFIQALLTFAQREDLELYKRIEIERI